MNKILVTGANGQLGMSFRYWASRFDDFEFNFTDLPELDLTKQSKLKNYLKNKPVDCVINCAAYTAVDKAEKENEKTKKLNLGVVQTLCELAELYSFKLIHFSTDYVFDGSKNKPYQESDSQSPINFYGDTKAKGEKLILNSGINAWIIRTSWLFSPFRENFVVKILSLLKSKREISVVNDQMGSPTYAIDLAKLILKALSRKSFGSGVKIYHLTNSGNATWYQIAKKIKEMTNLDCEILPAKSDDKSYIAKRPRYSVLSCGRIKKDFNLESRSWTLALNDCIEKILN